jgi:uncharacterized protein with GYD domain
LLHASYTAEGTRGLLKEGGSARRKSVVDLLTPLGGKLEAFYFTFGDEDAILIVDVPDAITGAALNLAVNASGTVRSHWTMLMTPEEIDEAVKRPMAFRPPGA